MPEEAVPYGAVQEYGSSSYWVGEPEAPRKHDTYTRTGKGSEVGYSPFLRTALYQLEPDFPRIIQEEIVKSILE